MELFHLWKKFSPVLNGLIESMMEKMFVCFHASKEFSHPYCACSLVLVLVPFIKA